MERGVASGCNRRFARRRSRSVPRGDAIHKALLGFFLGGLFEMFTSCFVGFLAFWVCHDVLRQPAALCSCAAGFAGNLGASVFDFGKHALRSSLGMADKEDGQ